MQLEARVVDLMWRDTVQKNDKQPQLVKVFQV
jgi:hypothetical protein